MPPNSQIHNPLNFLRLNLALVFSVFVLIDDNDDLCFAKQRMLNYLQGEERLGEWNLAFLMNINEGERKAIFWWVCCSGGDVH